VRPQRGRTLFIALLGSEQKNRLLLLDTAIRAMLNSLPLFRRAPSADKKKNIAATAATRGHLEDQLKEGV